MTLRARGATSWGAELMKFVGENLPNILNGLKEGQEAEALEALGKAYRERRTETMVDRREEIAGNRAEVDERLAERKRGAKSGDK